jgi:hypothetical protein
VPGEAFRADVEFQLHCRQEGECSHAYGLTHGHLLRVEPAPVFVMVDCPLYDETRIVDYIILTVHYPTSLATIAVELVMF